MAIRGFEIIDYNQKSALLQFSNSNARLGMRGLLPNSVEKTLPNFV